MTLLEDLAEDVEDARREWRAEMNREMRDMIDWIDVGMEEELKG